QRIEHTHAGKESDIPILVNPSSCGCNMFQHELWHSGLTLPRPYPRKRDSIALRTAAAQGGFNASQAVFRYRGANTPSAWLTSYRLAGDNHLDCSEIEDGYGGKSCRVGAGQQAG